MHNQQGLQESKGIKGDTSGVLLAWRFPFGPTKEIECGKARPETLRLETEL